MSSQVPTSNKKGCCYYLCKCFFLEDDLDKKDKSNSQKSNDALINNIQFKKQIPENKEKNENIENLEIPQVQTQAHQQNTQQITQQYPNIIIDKASEDKILHIKNKFNIQTKIKRDKIISAPDFSKELNNKYSCPICLNYFNHILKLSCCKNYICHLCSEDYLDTCIKYDFSVNCPFCGVRDKNIFLEDVLEGDKLKVYSDADIIELRKTISGRFSRILNLEDIELKKKNSKDLKEDNVEDNIKIISNEEEDFDNKEKDFIFDCKVVEHENEVIETENIIESQNAINKH
jgi:hypothetical protein